MSLGARARLVKFKNFLFPPVALVWVGCARLGKVLGGSRALGDLGRDLELCGRSTRTMRQGGLVAACGERRADASRSQKAQEAWESGSEDPKSPIRSPTLCFPLGAGSRHNPPRHGAVGSKAIFLLHAAARDSARTTDVCTLTNHRDTILGSPFFVFGTHSHSCLQP